MRLSDWKIEINWEAPLSSQHRALELLAWMVMNEWSAPIAEAIQTWGPYDLTDADAAMLREVFPDSTATATNRQE